MPRNEYEEVTPDTVWTCMDGKRMLVREMTDTHLLNAINVLRNKSPHGTVIKLSHVCRRSWTNVMANEAYSRGLQIEQVDENDPVHE